LTKPLIGNVSYDVAFLRIIGRAANAFEGFSAAIDRASRYIETGADMTFVERPRCARSAKLACSMKRP
jgi:2-methylisocitrate lyase-like PEP mutase family enzyme